MKHTYEVKIEPSGIGYLAEIKREDSKMGVFFFVAGAYCLTRAGARRCAKRVIARDSNIQRRKAENSERYRVVR